MADEERLIIVETMATYRPFFQFGLGLVDIRSRALVKQRFAPQVVYGGSRAATRERLCKAPCVKGRPLEPWRCGQAISGRKRRENVHADRMVEAHW